MGLLSALNTALTGISVNQRQLDVTASNIANADRAGYTRKTLQTSLRVDGQGRTLAVSAGSLSRILNTEVQTQYRSALSQQQFAQVGSDYFQFLDRLFATIDDPGSLSNTANGFSASLANLVGAPEDYPSRIAVVQQAERFASKLSSLSGQIQSQRQAIEFQLAESVDRVNTLLSNLQELDVEIIAQTAGGLSPVELLDERDRVVDELSGFLDIQVDQTENGGLRLTTTSGFRLYDVVPTRLSFDAHGTIGALSRYSKDPQQRNVGTITLGGEPGQGLDLIAAGGLRSGSIAALVQARDVTLVDAQRQLDELAANLAQSFSTHEEAATPYVTGGVQTGYEFDLSKLAEGDSLAFSFKDLTTGITKNVTLFRSDGPGAPDITRTSDPNDIYIGIDFSSGDYDTIAAAVQSALGSDPRVGSGVFAASNPDDPGPPAAETSILRLVSASPGNFRIETAKSNISIDDPSQFADVLALFVDSDGSVFTGLKDGRPNVDGFASRIRVNSAFRQDPGLLVEYRPGIEAGDVSRPQAILDRFTQSERAYTTSAKVGTRQSVYKGSITDFVTSTVAYTSNRAAQSAATAAGQEVVTNNLKTRFDEGSKVDVDQELGHLIQIQNAYQANARVLQAARELFEALLRT